jgi:hypothetical protein
MRLFKEIRFSVFVFYLMSTFSTFTERPILIDLIPCLSFFSPHCRRQVPKWTSKLELFAPIAIGLISTENYCIATCDKDAEK